MIKQGILTSRAASIRVMRITGPAFA